MSTWLIVGLMIGFIGMTRSAESGNGPLDFSLTANDGKDYPLAQHAGKVVMLVNTASKCGLTPQYKALEALWRKYRDQGLVVIGVPANEFRGQEPGSDADIRTFCTTKYDVTFPLMAKTVVKGDGIHPLFHWLTKASPKVYQGDIGWNFAKFLVGRDGALVARFDPKQTPDDPTVTQAIEAALAAKAAKP